MRFRMLAGTTIMLLLKLWIWMIHGLIVKPKDKIQMSQSIMKYLLATITKLMEVFAEAFLYGYNINHVHNQLYQVWHHSKFMVGAGKEDFETCTFIYCNYMQALKCIHSHKEFLRYFDLTPQDFESDLTEECSYLEATSQCKSGDSIQVEYVKALNDLDLARFTNKDITNHQQTSQYLYSITHKEVPSV
ncbi:hypothetical protein BDR03DRAFT_982856 [Suillus americanus]|nr:hypothetical protein BDR03DRAFT_982856 [Suillus americanus]